MNRFPSPQGIPLKGVSFCLWLVVFPFHTPFSFPGTSACSCVEPFGLGGISAETSAGTGSPSKAPAHVGQLCPPAPDSSLPAMEPASPWSSVGDSMIQLELKGRLGSSAFGPKWASWSLSSLLGKQRWPSSARPPWAALWYESGAQRLRLVTPESCPQPQPLEKGISVSKKVLLAPGLASCGLILSSSLALAQLSLYFADSLCYLQFSVMAVFQSYCRWTCFLIFILLVISVWIRGEKQICVFPFAFT